MDFKRMALVEGPPLQAAAAVRVLVALPLTVSHDFFGALWLLWQTGDCVRVTSGMQIPADLLLISASAVSPESSPRRMLHTDAALAALALRCYAHSAGLLSAALSHGCLAAAQRAGLGCACQKESRAT